MTTPKTKYAKVKLEFLYEFDEDVSGIPEGFSAIRAVQDGWMQPGSAKQTVQLIFPKGKK